MCSLKHLAKITFINTVDHRERFKTIVLPKKIKNELLRDYNKYLNFNDVIQLNIWDEKATNFMMLEDKIKYDTIYPRNFMCIIKSNPWIRETFNTFSHEWHSYINVTNTLKQITNISLYLHAPSALKVIPRKNIWFISGTLCVICHLKTYTNKCFRKVHGVVFNM